MKEQTVAAELKEKLMHKPTNGWTRLTPQQQEEVMRFAEGYTDFLGKAKTEREAVILSVAMLEKANFRPFDPAASYQAGDRVYTVNRNKAIIAAVIGQQPLEQGVRIVAAHIDAPRLDLKQHPLYEADELAYFKTHYYGGIRKYQWATVPLSLHGVVVRADGASVTVNIGEDAGDPQFVITDLLPHLSAEQNKRTLADGIRGEELNVLIGSRPFNNDEEAESVKLQVMNILNEKYGITEADFMSAELEIVPAAKPVDIGLDRSMIGAYAHDDRVCAYPALMATLALDVPEKTVVTVLADKEETGSDGNTGLNSSFLRYFVEDLAECMGAKGHRVLSASQCLSADVNGAFDPTFSDPYEKRNSCYLNYGAVLTKYTGGRGKYDTSDASAEFTGAIRNKMDEAGVIWQTGELGKVDAGGGGTVAKYIANLNVDVIDLGVPVLCMHAPFEVIAKLDLYMAYRAIQTFYC